MPAVPGSGFIVVQPEFIFGGLEAILDRPAMTFDLDKNIYGRARWTPCGEEGQVAIGDVAPDQEAPASTLRSRPHRSQQRQGRPALCRPSPCSLAPLVPSPAESRFQSDASSVSCDLVGRTDNRRLAPGAEVVLARDAQHIALAGLAQRGLHIAHAVDAVRGHPGERRSWRRSPARSSVRASWGLVEKPVPAGTWAAANRSASSVHTFGRYNARSMKA